MADLGGALDQQLFETRTVLVFGELTPALVQRDLERAYWLDAAQARQYGLVGQVIEGLDEVG